MGRQGKQAGFAMIEVIVVMALGILVAVWGASALVRSYEQQVSRADAVWMLELRSAVAGYISKHRQTIIQATDTFALVPAGYADWSMPAQAELQADGLLSNGFPVKAQSFTASVRLIREGVCPSETCRIQAFIFSQSPYLTKDSGLVDQGRLAEWLLAAQGKGGHVASLAPLRLRGAAFDYPNPPWEGEALAPGTVVMSVAYNDGDGQFLRVRDSRNPDFQGPMNVAGPVTAAQSLTVDGVVQINALATRKSGCGQAGALARTADGELLSCRAGIWTVAGPRPLGAFSINSLYGCATSEGGSTANPVTQKCSCPMGAAVVLVSDSGPQPDPLGRVNGFVCVD